MEKNYLLCGWLPICHCDFFNICKSILDSQDNSKRFLTKKKNHINSNDFSEIRKHYSIMKCILRPILCTDTKYRHYTKGRERLIVCDMVLEENEVNKKYNNNKKYS